MSDLRGKLLISSGGLFDQNFRHTVVLVAEHGVEGAVGVILNRPLDTTVADAVPPLAELVSEDDPLYEGGPVQTDQPVLLLELSGGREPDIPILEGIGFQVGDVTPELAPHIVRARIFAGHAGWGLGQIEAELNEGSWIVDPARSEDIFTRRPDTLWHRVLRRKGPEYRHMSTMPYDPRMN